jgi:hypothetical protein
MFKFQSVPAYTFAGKPKNRNQEGQPGPGAYSIDATLNVVGRKSPNVVWGKAARNGGKGMENPGPGAYDNSGLSSKARGGVIGKRNHQNHGAMSPGPGAYDLSSDPKTGNNKGGFAFGKQGLHSLNKSALLPGPGAYDINSSLVNRKGSATAMSRAARNILNKSETPGPGAYDYKDNIFVKSGHGGVLGKAPRDGLRNGNNDVGPGAYDLKREFDQLGGPGFKMSKASRGNGAGGDLPGPGQYDVESVYSKMTKGRAGR